MNRARKVQGWQYLILVLVIGCAQKEKRLQTIHVTVDTLSQIVLVEDSVVKPIVYNHIIGLDSLPTPTAKKLFISALLPSILIAKHHLSELRAQIHELADKNPWTREDSIFFNTVKAEYKATDLENLLLRLSTVPNSIVLAQAALESGWGKSRFFREGNNIFGMWSYNENEPRLQARQRRENGHIHVRVYDDFSQSIEDYFKTLATARAYRNLRLALKETNDVEKLLPHLKYYSERRMEYVDQLKKIIDQNDLTQYDRYYLDPNHFIVE